MSPEPSNWAARSGKKPDEAARDIPMCGFNRTKDGELTSKNFFSCWALLVYNEETRETTGFHILGPQAGITGEQRDEIIQMAGQPGKKHAALMYGTYYFQDNKQIEEKLTADLKELLPGVNVLPAKKVTGRNYVHDKNHFPVWDFRFHGRSGLLTVTERPEVCSKDNRVTGFHYPFQMIIEPQREVWRR